MKIRNKYLLTGREKMFENRPVFVVKRQTGGTQ